MTTNPVTLRPDQALLEVKHIFEKHDFHHHIPVCENGKLIGMVSLIDFVRQLKGSSLDDNDQIYSEMRVADIMSINPRSIAPSTSIHNVASILAEGNIHALTITENDQLVGIVSTADIIRYYMEERSF
jgi:CBS domain-containing protein